MFGGGRATEQQAIQRLLHLETATLIYLFIAVRLQHPLLQLREIVGKVEADTKEDKQRPLPAERVDGHAEHEPPDELQIGEEVKGGRGREGLEDLGEADPAAHPKGRRPGERVRDEHEHDARVDANVPVADGADGGNVGAVDGGHAGVRRRERLEVPIGRAVGVLEAVVWEERQRGALESGGHDDNVGVHHEVFAGTALRDALRAVVHVDAVFGEALNVAADPLRLAIAQLLHNVRVDHGRVGEEADVGGRNVRHVAVEELAEERLGDPRQQGLVAKDVHAE